MIGEHTGVGWVPFVAADETRLAQLTARAHLIARASGRTVRLVRFDVRVDLEEIKP